MTTELLDAFARVRVAAEDHMDERDKLGLPWSEESVTEISTHKGAPEVQVVPFNPKQEGGGVGADYLWCWLDKESSECFGMLVQAKVLKWSPKGPTVDVGYKSGKQLKDLLATALQLEVPAIYAVYTGGRLARAEHPLHHMHSDGSDEPDVDLDACTQCRRMTIGLISAFQVQIGFDSALDTATTFLNDYIALEALVDPALNAGAVHDLNVPEIGDGKLLNWLLHEQLGAREVAKRIFKGASAHRNLAFSKPLTTTLTVPGAPVFAEVPQDNGHYPGPYFAHFLRGLRKSPPSYVLDAMTGGEMPPEIVQAVDGLVIVRV